MPVYLGLTYSVFMGWDDVMLQSEVTPIKITFVWMAREGAPTYVLMYVPSLNI